MTLAEYFEANRPKAKFDLGDRVHGKWNGIPFVGTAGADIMVNEAEGSMVSVHLDLPIKYKGAWSTIVRVKQKELKRLSSLEDTEPLKLKEAGSIPARRTKQVKK
jgi:hypothetical protein